MLGNKVVIGLLEYIGILIVLGLTGSKWQCNKGSDLCCKTLSQQLIALKILEPNVTNSQQLRLLG